MQKEVQLIIALILQKWAVYQIFGSILPQQRKIKPDIMANYLFALRSYYIDWYMSLEAFNKLHIAWIIKEKKRFFLRAKKP